MSLVLVAAGCALLLFGGVVLLRYSDRPGASIKWLGVEVSSAGAGLPLVALGVGCILFAVLRNSAPERSGTSAQVSSRTPTEEVSPGGTAPIPPSGRLGNSTDCLSSFV